jgi:hypothetical protein
MEGHAVMILYYHPLKFPASPSVYLFIALVALWENGLPYRIVGYSQSAWILLLSANIPSIKCIGKNN